MWQAYRKILWHLCLVGCSGLLLQLLSPLGVLAQSPNRRKDLDQIKTMFRAGSCAQAIPRLRSFRTEEYGKTFEVDYMLGVCLCRTDRRREGVEYLNRALDYAGVENPLSGDVRSEMDWCAAAPNPFRLVKRPPLRTPSVTGSGSTGRKTYYQTRVFRPYASAALDPIGELSSDALEKRLIELTQPTLAISQFRSLNLGNFRRVVTVGHFIMASTGNMRPSDLRRIGENLEQTLQYFVSTFQIPEPRYYITVFIVPNPVELDLVARRIHHLELHGDTIGYSFQEDLSITAIVWRMVYGTLKHELFHLVVRSNFGDIPPWLDEGMAALYEQSHQIGGRVIGERNWRGGILRRRWTDRPSLQSLLKLDWSSFNNRNVFSEQVLTNHAFARYFILYLQEVGKLAAVYNAIRKGEFDSINHRSIQAVELTFGKSLTAVDADFSDWFLRLPMTVAESLDH